MKAEDGHDIDSEYERKVDNALSISQLKHFVHPKILDSNFKADFKVEEYVFVEVWGIKDEEYQERSKRKLDYYIAKGLNNRLVQIKAEDCMHVRSLMKKIEEIKSKIRPPPPPPEWQYLFNWDNIPGNDNERLIKFLKQNFDVKWVTTAKIEKIDGGKTIKLSTEKNYLFLRLNDKNTKVNLEIDDDKIDEYIAKTEYSKLNIYLRKREPTPAIPKLFIWNLAELFAKDNGDLKDVDTSIQKLENEKKETESKLKEIDSEIIKFKKERTHKIAKYIK